MWFEIEKSALTALVATPLLAAAAASVLGRRAPALTARLGVAAAGAGFLLAAMLATVAGRGAVVSTGTGVWAIAADRLAVVLFLLIFGVSTVAQAFALRYLAGDRRAGWFTGGAGLLTAASAVLVSATTLVGVAIGWTVAGIALCLLLGTYPQLPSARDGVRRAGVAFLIGDAALWIAVALLGLASGSITVTDVARTQIGGPVAVVAVLLIVVAALSRSAQIPFHRWLPATLSAPTPVSALLHAGVVNAGGILLIRMSPLPNPAVAAGLLVTAGTASMVYGTTIMLVKPDIKGALAYSTMAQMGFMIVTCGLGLWAATVLHLVAHGFYKATLFLSSGSAIARARRHAALPIAPRPSGRRRSLGVACAAALPALALYAAVRLISAGPHHPAEQALLLFAWVSGAVATWGWMQRRSDLAGALLAAAVLVPVAVGYVAIINAVSEFLAPALPGATISATTVWATVGLTLILLTAIAGLRRSPAITTAHRLVYTHALTAGTIDSATSGARR
ncbi:proton-conducting transporter transmembrane domain-containing protein [Mycolicibacterium tokaiense]|uniref:NADH dehydrogenase subunit L n=1 Tax=Mycolicibacterium tokaiense TaxID=39695 RepID=A0A378TDM2_9MYCO|nr:proton-conducting transporter membrane subunit [Mycolicibacterium tokaiense]BBY87855.1 NADH dehydrogenase [Mycolicibacterium tokaiense]STZ57626.1 NADH dehydrogenase subunit L [Mycolicibacterium tokaiense]